MPCTSSSPPTPTGEVALVLPLARPARATIEIEGESIHPRHVTLTREAHRRPPLPRPRRIPPPDFRRYTVTLEADGFAASRTLGLEIARDQPAPRPPTASPRPSQPPPPRASPTR